MALRRTLPLFPFLIVVIALHLVGFLCMYSASSVYAFEHFHNPHVFMLKQAWACLLGSLAATVVVCIPTHYLRTLAPLCFVITLFGTLAVHLPGIGVTINGARRWISLFGITLQPSEILKVCYTLYIGYLLHRFYYTLKTWSVFLRIFSITLLTAAVLLTQPDFGQAVTVTVSGMLLYMVVSGTTTHVVTIAIPLLCAAVYLVAAYPYRLRRILIFLHPWEDARGKGFQIIQSLIAIGSGGTLGRGIGHSQQKCLYLPMQHNDFIYSIIAEETGLVGVSLLFIMYLYFIYIVTRVVRHMETVFTYTVTTGYLLFISIQTIMHMYVTTGLAPTKGIGLPFISYGSSACIGNLIFTGVVINCILLHATTPRLRRVPRV